jgi:Abnormal spindle-like microcephaly-assoc'd, ASPM-SPD-2-Hydin
MPLPQSIIQSLFVRTVHFLTIGMAILLFGMVPVRAGAATLQLACTPTNLRFGAVVVGQTETLLVTLTNNGQSSVTVSGIAVGKSEFTTSNLSLPLVLLAGQSVDLSVSFTPTAMGWTGGTIKFFSNASNATLHLDVGGTGVRSESVTASPSMVSFGQVAIGTISTVPVVLTNARSWKVTLSALQTTSGGFSMSGPMFPLTLGAGQSVTLNVAFAPQSAGTTGGSLFVSGPQLAIPLTGTGTAPGQLSANPSSLNFANVPVGSSQMQSATLTNSGGSSLTVSQATLTGTSFTLSGLTLPLTLGAGQSATFSVVFAPQSAGSVSGNVAFTSNASNPAMNLPLSGTGVTQGTLTANPTSLAFGNVQVRNNTSLSETLTNTGGTSLTISAAAASGSGFSLSGLTLPLTLTAGQSTSFTVSFSPTASGTASGSVSITSTGSDSNLSIPLSGTGVTGGTLTANPTSLAFGSVQVAANSASLSETLTNSGGSTITISQANLTGAVFSVSGLTLPLTLTASQSVTFTATFAPTSAGAASRNLSVVSNASNSPLNIALSGTGTSAGQLAVSPTSLSFGNVVVGSSASLNGSLNASGASVTVTSASLTNGEFVLSGISLPATIPAGQSATFTVTFTPGASGGASASLSFSSNAANSPAVQSMTGTGTAPAPHTVDLTWNASANAVGYNVYRSTVSGGPYSMINTSLDATTAYTDTTVSSGQTYYYVTTAVNGSSNESGYSNQSQAVIPNP